MSILENVTFSFTEMLTLLGLAQALMITLHVTLRMVSFREAVAYLLYFLTLSIGFILEISYRIDIFYDQIHYMSWFVWSMTTPLSVLVILQILSLNGKLHYGRYSIILIQPVIAIIAAYLVTDSQTCASGLLCDEAFRFYFSAGIIAQCLSFAYFYGVSLSATSFKKQKNYSERYWLIICLLVINLILISLSLWYLNHDVSLERLAFTRIILGLVFVYIVSTLMFRVYPSVLHLKIEPSTHSEDKTGIDLHLKSKIEHLMVYDKLYQEASFSRSDLAHELKRPEATISKVINLAFNENFTTFINRYRVNEAKDLLENSQYTINDIAKMVGFNSIASFNRVFKDQTDQTPSLFRKNMRKKIN